MYMRLVRIKAKMDMLTELVSLYETKVIPSLERVHGCRYAGMMQSVHHPDQCLSLTFWNSRTDVEAYEQGDVFASLLDESKPYFLESSEFQIRLSENLTLECAPVPEEPVVSTMPVTAKSSSNTRQLQAGGARWLRTVALKIRQGKMEEFRQMYVEQVIPALREVEGCRYIYLTENPEKPNEVISITSWESEQDAMRYEQSGWFQKLLESQKHLLSDLYQWKREQERDHVSRVATSEDLTVEHYTVLAGKDFDSTS